MGFFLFREGPQGVGPGAVSGPGVVVSAGVRQKKALAGDGAVTLRGGGVVDNGAVGTGGQNGVKTGLEVQGAGPAEGLQLGCGGTLGNGLASHLGLEPVHKPGQCDPVGQMGLLHVGDLHGIFDGFAQSRGVGAVHHGNMAGNAGQEGGVDPPGVQHDPLAGGEAAYIGINTLVGTQGDPVGLQLLQDRRGEHGRIGKENRAVLGKGQIAQDHWVAGHVSAPQVQQPGDVLQGSEKEHVGTLRGHGPPDFPELFPAAHAGVFL